MLLQAYDFVVLNDKHKCRLQLGGSDQWGNIVNGVELGRRLGKPELFGLTTPLLTTSSGAKMGKTAAGAVWLSEDLLSPYDYYQFWRNTEDADVVRFLRMFTDLPDNELDELSNLQGAELNEAKKILAYAATKLCHGKEQADIALDTAIKTFEKGALGDALPVLELSREELQKGIHAYELLCRIGLVSSNGEGKRLIKGKGAKLNDKIIETESSVVTEQDLTSENIIKLSAGKKNHAIIRLIGQ